MSTKTRVRNLAALTAVALLIGTGAHAATPSPTSTKKPTVTPSAKVTASKKPSTSKKPTTTKKPTVKPRPIAVPTGKPTVQAPGSTLTPPTASPRPSLTSAPKPQPRPSCTSVAGVTIKMFKGEAYVKNAKLSVKIGQPILFVIDADAAVKASFAGTDVGTIELSSGLSAICVAYPLVGTFPIAVGDLVPVVVTAA